MLVLAIVSRPLWLDVKDPDEFPEPGLELRILAKQFEWHVTYPGADGRIGTNDDFVRRNQLHVPAGVPVRFTLTSDDVIHSFFVASRSSSRAPLAPRRAPASSPTCSRRRARSTRSGCRWA